MMTFQKSQQSYGLYKADVLKLVPEASPAAGGSSSSSSPSCLIVMIPGNPGLPAFYEPFLKDIQASLGGTAVVASVSQLEHCPGPCATPPSTTCPSLDEQIRAKAQFIEEQQSEHPGLPTIVISHSLGGYMTVEVMKHYPKLNFQAILLFPSLSHMAETTSGQRLRYFLTAPTATIMSQMSKMFKLFPESALLSSIGFATGHSEQGRRVTAQLVTSPSVVWQTITLGQEELEEIRAPDLVTLEKCGRRIRCYWSKVHEDGWTNEADVDDIKLAIERGGGVALRCVEGVKHDFCVSDRHSTYMANVCVAWIQDMLSPESMK